MMKLNEEGYEKVTGYRAVGGSPGQWTQWGGPKGYSRNDFRTKADMEKGPESVVDPHIEQQLIDQAISILFNDHPELVNDKKIRRHHLQMLIGKVTSGEVSDLITMKNFIKSLKKRGVTVESETMKIRRAQLKEVVSEVINEGIDTQAYIKRYGREKAFALAISILSFIDGGPKVDQALSILAKTRIKDKKK